MYNYITLVICSWL